jgi:hypothetical protein
MMSIDTLLSRLTEAKRTGDGRYLACCPAHLDKRPSLAVRELDDERVLIHCFAGCSVEEVLHAVGLEFDALFPESPIGQCLHPERHPFSAKDILEAVRHETLIVSVAASTIAHGKTLVKDDYERLILASRRLQTAGGYHG